MKLRNLLVTSCLLSFTFCALLSDLEAQQQTEREKSRKPAEQGLQEEIADYYKKWLEQDVLFIISDEERDIFEALSTPEEKDNFIEQFWLRRDTDPRTAENEFKEEHYRRIAYANEKFTSGDPGWMTDRGRIYIIHGQPDSIESRPDGGRYLRPIEEGGGITAVVPYEKWRYRYIEGIGPDVEVEFIDPTQSGEFKLATFYWEKDVFMHNPGGATLFEEIGMSTKAERPGLMPAAGGAGAGIQSMFMRYKDTPFARYETLAKVGGAPITKYDDLKQLVNVDIKYVNLPFEVRQDYFRLNAQQILVPVTVQVRNQDLTFKSENGFEVARMAVYGMVTSMTNRFILEFEDDVITSYPQEQLQEGLQKSSVYQKIIPVDGNMRYKIDLVLKDLNSGNTGVIARAISPPPFSQEQLSGSSLILSDHVEPLEAIPDGEEMFVLGDVRILPNMERRFTEQTPLGLYFQVYNAQLDQTTLTPALQVTYRLFDGDRLLRMATDENDESTQFFSAQRVVLVKKLSLAGLEPGRYRVQIEVVDRLSDHRLEMSESFRVVEGRAGAS